MRRKLIEIIPWDLKVDLLKIMQNLLKICGVQAMKCIVHIA